MAEKENSINTAKATDGKQQMNNQNQQHNTKKVALGPNTKR